MAKQVNTDRGTVRILDNSVLGAYNESIKSYNEIAGKYLGQFKSYNGELTGSSPLMIIQLINSGVLPEETRLATREDLENAISQDDSFLRENYTDFGLALRTAGDSYHDNDLLAKRLAQQLKQRDITLGKGKLIPLDVLSLADEKESAYGVVIELKDGAESSIRNLSDYEWDCTREDGLSCAYLLRGRDWDSYGAHLAYSDAGGRVVVVSAKSTTKNFSDDLMLKVQSFK